MARTVACMIVQDDQAFRRLGHLTVLSWCLGQLLEARGVDRSVCVVSAGLADTARQLLAVPEEVEVVPAPADLLADRAGLDSWLCGPQGPAAGAAAVAVLRPATPFLPAAKIEECVARVVDGGSPACQPAWLFRQGHVLLDSLRVFAAPPAPAVRVDIVPVGLVEALDVNEPDGYRVASALVLCGAV
jgi:hypothetical protein